MPPSYEETRSPRFRIDVINGQEHIIIPPERSLFIILFLAVWLCGWSSAGVAQINTVLSRNASSFLVFWLMGWALGEAFAVLTLCWLLAGAETVRVVGSDLEVGYRLLGWHRTKLYRGRDIRGLSAWIPALPGRYNQVALPFLNGNKTGSVKFSYGMRTVFLAPGLDETEGRMIVAHVRPALPSTAMD